MFHSNINITTQDIFIVFFLGVIITRRLISLFGVFFFIYFKGKNFVLILKHIYYIDIEIGKIKRCLRVIFWATPPHTLLAQKLIQIKQKWLRRIKPTSEFNSLEKKPNFCLMWYRPFFSFFSFGRNFEFLSIGLNYFEKRIS